ncbi:unnamed protein product, partial [Nesidiocoris tenuis]
MKFKSSERCLPSYSGSMPVFPWKLPRTLLLHIQSLDLDQRHSMINNQVACQFKRGGVFGLPNFIQTSRSFQCSSWRHDIWFVKKGCLCKDPRIVQGFVIDFEKKRDGVNDEDLEADDEDQEWDEDDYDQIENQDDNDQNVEGNKEGNQDEDKFQGEDLDGDADDEADEVDDEDKSMLRMRRGMWMIMRIRTRLRKAIRMEIRTRMKIKRRIIFKVKIWIRMQMKKRMILVMRMRIRMWLMRRQEIRARTHVNKAAARSRRRRRAKKTSALESAESRNNYQFFENNFDGPIVPF